MTAEAGERFAGLTVMEAREAVVAELEREGRIVAREDYEHEVPYSHRSGQRIEPLISLQWFMSMDELARPAVAAVREGRVRIVPENHRRVYLDWMENIRPWCISRQLWWGHRLPVYYCETCGHVNVALSAPRRCAECGRAPPPRGGCAGHVVLLRAVAVCDARLAAGHPRAESVLPDERALHRQGHPVPVGRAHDHDGDRADRRGAVLRRLHPLGDPGARRAAHVQVAGDRHRPIAGDRPPWRRCGALRPACDVLHAGRSLLSREGPAGSSARQQAVQRGAFRA